MVILVLFNEMSAYDKVICSDRRVEILDAAAPSADAKALAPRVDGRDKLGHDGAGVGRSDSSRTITDNGITG